MTTEKSLSNDVPATNIPLDSINDPAPSAYEHPHIDFHRGWRDRSFAIAFWIYASLIIITGFLLGRWSLIPLSQHYTFHLNLLKVSTFNETIFLYAISLLRQFLRLF